MKLDVGSGPYPAQGYTSVDLFTAADIQAEMWDLPLEADSVSEIRSVHSLEHVSKFQVMPTLQEWYRVLIPGGLVTIEVPDLAWCVTKWLEHQTADWWMDIIFGNQAHDGEYHRTGFTPQLLTDYLMAAGFTGIDVGSCWSHEQQSLSAQAVKPL